MLSAPVGERRTTVGGCPWGPGLWRWLVQHWGRNFSFRIEARTFWANNFHHSATPTTAQTLPTCCATPLPGGASWKPNSPSPCTLSYRIVGDQARPPRDACRADSPPQPRGIPGPVPRHGQDWPCNLYVAMPGIGLSTTRMQRHCRAKWLDILRPGDHQRRPDFLNFMRPGIGQCRDRMPNESRDKHPPPPPT